MPRGTASGVWPKIATDQFVKFARALGFTPKRHEDERRAGRVEPANRLVAAKVGAGG